MTRLTNAFRDQIIAAALAKAGVTARKEKLAQDRTAFAYACRERSLGGPEGIAKLADLMERRLAIYRDLQELLGTRAPGRYSNGASRMHANIAGRNLRLEFDKCEYYCEPFAVVAGDPLDVEFTRMENEEAEIGKLFDEIHGAVKAVVYKAGTLKSLLAMWPEVKELLPAPSQPAAALPMVQVEDLNRLVGLPTEQAGR